MRGHFGNCKLMFDNESADNGFEFERVSSSRVALVKRLLHQYIGFGNEFFCSNIHRKPSLLENQVTGNNGADD